MKKEKNLNNLLYNNSFISLDIHYFAETNDLIYYNYECDDFNLHIYSAEEIKNDFIKDLVLIYHMLSKITNKKANNINIRLLLAPNKKRIKTNNDYKILCCQNINSGSSLTETYVNLWRKEELEKVYIHELIHCLRIDDHSWSNNNYNNFIKKLKDNYNINGEIRPFEAYTDSLAILFHTVFIGFKLSMNKKEIYNLLSVEISYILFQAAKILNFYNIIDINQLKDSDYYINQNTSVFSYYILKASILFNLKDFLIFLNDDFNLENRIKGFENCVNKFMIDDNFNNIIRKYSSLIKNEKNNKYIFYNLRMSSLQI